VEKGYQVRGYVFDRALGEGGMGKVFLAHRTGAAGFSTKVVVKVLLNESDLFRNHFQTEAHLGGLFRNNNVVGNLDYFEHDGHFFMVQEWVDGVDVEKLLKLFRQHRRANTLPIWWVMYIATEALSGLDYVHNLRIDDKPGDLVHRDLSPDNILVSRFSEVKVGDFGIAKANIRGRVRTQHAMYKGKPTYSAPEQLEALPDVDRRADIYSMGVILYELLTGQPPYSGHDTLNISMQIREGRVAPIRVLRPEVSADLAAAVMRMLKWDRRERPQTAELALCELVEHAPAFGAAKTEIASFLRRSLELPSLELPTVSDPVPIAIDDERTVREKGAVPHYTPQAPTAPMRIRPAPTPVRARPRWRLAFTATVVSVAAATALSIAAVSRRRPARVPSLQPSHQSRRRSRQSSSRPRRHPRLRCPHPPNTENASPPIQRHCSTVPSMRI
jgi:serine/threonine-protein kinase